MPSNRDSIWIETHAHATRARDAKTAHGPGTKILDAHVEGAPRRQTLPQAREATRHAVAQVTMSLEEKLIMTNDAYGTVEVRAAQEEVGRGQVRYAAAAVFS